MFCDMRSLRFGSALVILLSCFEQSEAFQVQGSAFTPSLPSRLPTSSFQQKLAQRHSSIGGLSVASAASENSLTDGRLRFGEGRVAVVTGASRGLGKAIAEKLSASGVEHVVCVGRSDGSCDEVVKGIEANGGKASQYNCDVGNADEAKSVCDAILKANGRVDILVNNAGITKDNLFLRMSDKEWLDVINTNLNSVFYFTRNLIKSMSKNKWGRIVSLSSVTGVGGNPGQANYAASKAGIVGFTKTIAKELGSRHITANAIAPGFIKSAMTDILSDDVKNQMLGAIPAKRFGTGDEIAELVAFLSSENSAYINGHVIPIDGGMLFGYP